MPSLPQRAGPRPSTTSAAPHSQTDQQPADDRYLRAVLAAAATWPGVRRSESGISVPGAQALTLPDVLDGPAEAFFVDREFCHGHAQGDHSLHLTLPVTLAAESEAAGWTEPHFLVLTGQLAPTYVMLYAPRDDAEVAVALTLVRASYEFASGLTTAATTRPHRQGAPS